MSVCVVLASPHKCLQASSHICHSIPHCQKHKPVSRPIRIQFCPSKVSRTHPIHQRRYMSNRVSSMAHQADVQRRQLNKFRNGSLVRIFHRFGHSHPRKHNLEKTPHKRLETSESRGCHMLVHSCCNCSKPYYPPRRDNRPHNTACYRLFQYSPRLPLLHVLELSPLARTTRNMGFPSSQCIHTVVCSLEERCHMI